MVLDVCHAGGFATQEMGDGEPVEPGGFDFLENEVVRLKDLGQQESALLASSYAAQTSAVRDDRELSVMTSVLLSSVRRAPAQLELGTAFQACETGMAAYFEAANAQRQSQMQPPLPPHQPYLTNYCSRPVFLKP